MKRVFAQLIVCSALAAGGTAMAKAPRPATNVRMRRHPNLAEAQRLVAAAYAKIVAAQKANEFDLGGHAEKAKALLNQASAELKLAAQKANRR